MTFWWPMLGQRLPKLPNVSKNVQSSKCSKQHFQGLAKKVPVKECVRVFCQPVQACSGPDTLSSLPQPSPARPGARSCAQLPRGPGRVPIVQGAS